MFTGALALQGGHSRALNISPGWSWGLLSQWPETSPCSGLFSTGTRDSGLEKQGLKLWSQLKSSEPVSQTPTLAGTAPCSQQALLISATNPPQLPPLSRSSSTIGACLYSTLYSLYHIHDWSFSEWYKPLSPPQPLSFQILFSSYFKLIPADTDVVFLLSLSSSLFLTFPRNPSQVPNTQA